MLKAAENALRKLGKWLTTLCCLLLFASIFLVAYEVLMRYAFNKPPMLADELVGYSLFITVVLAIAYVWNEDSHIRVTALVDIIPKKHASWIRVLTDMLGLIFVVLMIYGGIGYLQRAFLLNLPSNSSLAVPIKWIKLLFLIGCAVLALSIVVSLIKHIDIAKKTSSNKEKVS